ncbi:PAF acetylhydrolase family protein [Boeremia exigua]|uniref:PAF acetylhydrolase family protein n=1 Tax=Boeremia exigua TaxID=749465 RepID=UPI001E8D79C5|nr:PAF acetylhydrolase family protein [Boeremia exigua]KAH6618423.1 PAF acetylhydrolase family protein [Boeremia exigua]
MHFKISFFPLLLATTGTGYLIPSPPGRYNVTITTGAIVDNNRDSRTFMLSVFQPATCTSTVPVVYMPNRTAAYEGTLAKRNYNISYDLTPLFATARQPVCPKNYSPRDDAPVLLLSPGYRGSRLYYNFLASAIASEGITVITMDHPGETSCITYPNGTAVYVDLPNPTNIDDETPYAYVRAADASFIIDQLSNATAMAKLVPRKVPTDRIVMAGHSIGGASAMLAASQDSRIRGVINWDGPFFGSLPSSGLSQPLLYVGTRRSEPRFTAIWPKLNGPKLWVEIANLTHEGMTDLPTLFQAVKENNTEMLAQLLGTIAPEQSVGILAAYALEWMKYTFAGIMGEPLLEDHGCNQFPEVSIVRKGNFYEWTG